MTILWRTQMLNRLVAIRGQTATLAPYCAPSDFAVPALPFFSMAPDSAPLPSGVTLTTTTGEFQISAGAPIGTTQRLRLRASDDISGEVADSPLFSLQVIAMPTAAFTNARTGATSNDFVTLRNAALPGDTIFVLPGKQLAMGRSHGWSGFVKCADPSQYTQVAHLGDGDTVAEGAGLATWWEGLYVNGFDTGNKVFGVSPDSGVHGGTWISNGHVMIKRCKFRECGQGIFGGGGLGHLVIWDTAFIDCGADTEVWSGANVHDIYVSSSKNLTEPSTTAVSLWVRGCVFYRTYDWSNTPKGELWRVGTGHLIKTDMAHNLVEASYLKTGRGSSTCKVQGDFGGVFVVRGCVLEEGPYSGFSASLHPSGPVPGQAYDNKIIDYAQSAIRYFGAPPKFFQPSWTRCEVHLQQNTIVNHGARAEQVVQFRGCLADRPTPIANGQYTCVPGPVPSVKQFVDNVIMKGAGLADIDVARPPSWVTDGSNTIATSDSIFHDATKDNYSLVRPVQGSRNWATCAFNFAAGVGWVVRTDFYRGGMPVPAPVPTPGPTPVPVPGTRDPTG